MSPATSREAMSILIRGTGTFWGNNPHFSLYSKGKKDADNCRKVPRTCAIIESFPEASSCKRCEVKFTALPPRTHVLPHVGPTNTILEVLVGLETEEGVRVRAAEETRSVVKSCVEKWTRVKIIISKTSWVIAVVIRGLFTTCIPNGH